MTEHSTIQNEGIWDGHLMSFDTLQSTNKWATDNIDQCEHGDVIWTESQTDGRGRFSREWLSPTAKCITLSVVLKTNDLPSPTIGQKAAMAVSSLLEENAITAGLKWPNDVLVEGKKIAGILLEQKESAVILGIGLNVNMTREDLSQMTLLQPATSMAIESGRDFDIIEMRKALCKELERTLVMLDEDLSCEWSKRDELTDKVISVSGLNQSHEGKYAGMAKDGQLQLILATGEMLSFWSGDASVKL